MGVYKKYIDQTNLVLEALKSSKIVLKGLGGNFARLKSSFYGFNHRQALVSQFILVFDSCIALLSFFLSIFLSVGNDFFNYSQNYIFKNMFVFLLTNLGIFLWMQIHKTFWKYFSLEDCVPLALAVFLSTFLFLPMMILLSQEEALPKSIPFINFILYLFLLTLTRYCYKILHEYRTQQKKILLEEHNSPVLLVGSSDSAERLIREIMHSRALSFHPIGIVSPEASEKGRKIYTVPILSLDDDIDNLVADVRSLHKRPQHLIITDDSLTKDDLIIISKMAQKMTLPVMQMIAHFTFFKSPSAFSQSPKHKQSLRLEPRFQKKIASH